MIGKTSVHIQCRCDDVTPHIFPLSLVENLGVGSTDAVGQLSLGKDLDLNFSFIYLFIYSFIHPVRLKKGVCVILQGAREQTTGIQRFRRSQSKLK